MSKISTYEKAEKLLVQECMLFAERLSESFGVNITYRDLYTAEIVDELLDMIVPELEFKDE